MGQGLARTTRGMGAIERSHQFTMRRDMQKSIITSLNGYTNILGANPTCKVDVRHKLALCQKFEVLRNRD